ncbi:lysine--tRNA ligase [Candidatus Woesearchaeota archaeon]|nr:lysine--tRNA ligase [Candidatus Woesearchaeota archaeon]
MNNEINEQKKQAKLAKEIEKTEEENTLMFWADQIAREVIERVESVPLLKKLTKQHGYIIYDEKTPSGKIHIGSGRGWVIHDAIAKALRDQGVKARFILSSDDIDPFDRMNSDLPPKFEKYLGMPFRDIPSPVNGYENFGQYYFMQCVEKFEEFGIQAEIESTGDAYDSGLFNDTIRVALNNIPKIKAIYEEINKKEYDKFPFNPICEKCGKIGTTKAYAWDAEKEIVKYRCEPTFVTWATGCGHEGEISPFDGNGKFPWKVEWAAKWPTKHVVYEVAGKDHFTKGGSRDVAIRIADQVFNYPVPLPSKVSAAEEINVKSKKDKKIGDNKSKITSDTVTKIYELGKAYEFFNIGGRKMSTSKGQGIAFSEVTDILPAYIVRYLLIRSRPHTVVDFDPFNRNDLILLFDRYDKTERIYFGADKEEENIDDKERKQQRRIYELSHVGKIPDKMPIQIPLTYASNVIQVGKNEEGAIALLKKSGHLPEDISGIDRHYLMQRFTDAKNWLERFATDEYKFIVTDEVKDNVKKNLNDKQRKVLHLLAKDLHNTIWAEKDLHNHFWKVCEKEKLDVKEFFAAAYSVLINKLRGPKLANFVLTVGQEKVADLFEST